MIRRKHRLSALGVCLLAAMSVMALAAGSAQAETGAKWLINGTQLSGSESITGSTAAGSSFLLEVLEEGVTTEVIHCSTLNIDEGKIEEPNGKNLGVLLFTNCLTLVLFEGELVDPEICDPVEPVVAEVKSLLILDPNETGTKKPYILFEPDNAEGIFTELEFKDPCPLPPAVPITGSKVAECVTLSGGVYVADTCLTEKVTQLIRPVQSLTLFPEDKLFFGVNEAHFEGVAALELSGANEEEPWSGHAG